jgi:hypothetical protein
MYVIQRCPSDYPVLEDVRIEPRTVTDLALTPRRSNHSAIDLVHNIECTIEFSKQLFILFYWVNTANTFNGTILR